MKFKACDRVAVYSGAGRWEGEITGIHDGLLRVLIGGSEAFWHPKQCRRLIKKKRREVWVSPHYLAGEYTPILGDRLPVASTEVDGWIRFVESKEKK